jgi:Holliday junction DNA helicase RuvB
MAERMVGPGSRPEDAASERHLRPRRLDEFIGQAKLKQQLRVYLQAARERGEALDHVLLSGAPGLGKTTLANILATEMGAKIKTTSGPAIERPGDLAADLTGLQHADLFFVDEIHRLSRTVEEYLYPAMEDFALDVVIGKGPSATTVRLRLKPFTLVGATTREELLTAPLRDRFGIQIKIDWYDVDSLVQIIDRSARILQVAVEPSGAEEIARRSRGTPRVANRLLKRVRDYAQVRGAAVVDAALAQAILAELEVDELGLDEVDRKYLHALVHRFEGGPVGVTTLAAATGIGAEAIEDVYEPFLIQLGFIDRTQRGRRAMPGAYRHLGLPLPGNGRPPQPAQFDDPAAG